MLIYILENVSSYPWNALEEIYCDLELFDEENYSVDIKQNTTSNIQILDNIEKIKKFLIEIRKKIESSKLNLDYLTDFNFVPKNI